MAHRWYEENDVEKYERLFDSTMVPPPAPPDPAILIHYAHFVAARHTSTDSMKN